MSTITDSHSSAPGANVIEEHYCSIPECKKWGGDYKRQHE